MGNKKENQRDKKWKQNAHSKFKYISNREKQLTELKILINHIGQVINQAIESDEVKWPFSYNGFTFCASVILITAIDLCLWTSLTSSSPIHHRLYCTKSVKHAFIFCTWDDGLYMQNCTIKSFKTATKKLAFTFRRKWGPVHRNVERCCSLLQERRSDTVQVVEPQTGIWTIQRRVKAQRVWVKTKQC